MCCVISLVYEFVIKTFSSHLTYLEIDKFLSAWFGVIYTRVKYLHRNFSDNGCNLLVINKILFS